MKIHHQPNFVEISWFIKSWTVMFLSFNRKDSIKTRSLTMCQHRSFGRWHNFLKDIDQLRCCTITNSMSFYTKTMFFQMAHSLAIWCSETGETGGLGLKPQGLRGFCNPMLLLHTTAQVRFFRCCEWFHVPVDCGFCWTKKSLVDFPCNVKGNKQYHLLFRTTFRLQIVPRTKK